MESAAAIGTCSSRESSMPSRTFSKPSFSRRNLKRETCSSGIDTRTNRTPSLWRKSDRTSTNLFWSFILPDSIMPSGMARSPKRPIRMPSRTETSPTNLRDSSEISKPKEGANRYLGIGKNRLKEFRSILVIIPFFLLLFNIPFIQISLQYQRGGGMVHLSAAIITPSLDGSQKFFFPPHQYFEFSLQSFYKKINFFLEQIR